MRCDVHCPAPGSQVPAVVVVVVLAVALAAVWTLVQDLVVAAAITLAVVAPLAVAAFVVIERRTRPALYATQRAGLPPPSRRGQVGAGRPAAIEGRPATVVVTRLGERGKVER